MTASARVTIAAVVTLILTAVTVFYIRHAVARSTPIPPVATTEAATGRGILVRSTAPGSRNRVMRVSLADHSAAPTSLTCSRVYASGGTTVCLRPEGALGTYQVAVLDARPHQTKVFSLAGLPNRARVSADGRMVAWTVFVTGDSYDSSTFSTRAGIFDTRTGELTVTLEDFAVTGGDGLTTAPDRNFWGITFDADDDHFYATMSTGGHRYLVAGDLAVRTVRILRDNVECPSLSPDGTRLAFKEAVGGDPAHGWRLSVLDLSTQRVTHLAETRSVDDQAMWLDRQTLAYAIIRPWGHADVWSAAADGSGTPKLLAAEADSPSPA
ncbi:MULTISPECIES: hypothetical protein [unclassified Nonomuraea]|uniref:hypothetical protein n=1 Tax=unclassified Nonomuraea TaxID=2593643 RepID=UPI0033E6FE7B